mmetsp:Transcript_31258/g.120409  ORF Transcript_31258/g.120409 Transcript_31258/m.120409 type:complete len:124 (-) Transcript_31258:2978-3349(-)
MGIGFIQVISTELLSNRRLVRCSSSAAAEIFSSKKLPVVYSDKFLQHSAGRPHPERPARVAAIKQRLSEDKEISQGISFLEPSADEDMTLKFISEVNLRCALKELVKAWFSDHLLCGCLLGAL